MVITYPIRADGNLDKPTQTAPAGGAGAGMVVSPDERFLYVSCISSDAVFGYRIGPVGELDPLPDSPFPAADFPEGAAITPDGRHPYLANPGGDRTNPGRSITAFTVGTDGQLQEVQGSPFTADDGAVGIAVTPDRRRLYTGNFDVGTVSAFTIATNGELQEIKGSPFKSAGARPSFQSVAIRPGP